MSISDGAGILLTLARIARPRLNVQVSAQRDWMMTEKQSNGLALTKRRVCAVPPWSALDLGRVALLRSVWMLEANC